MHQALLVFHRWLALIATVLVLVVATTGAAQCMASNSGRPSPSYSEGKANAAHRW